jgi:hypothetical protein
MLVRSVVAIVDHGGETGKGRFGPSHDRGFQDVGRHEFLQHHVGNDHYRSQLTQEHQGVDHIRVQAATAEHTGISNLLGPVPQQLEHNSPRK